jgi:hypothetical protein
MIYAIIKDDTVINMIIADTIDLVGLQENESALLNNNQELCIGAKLVDGIWVKPQYD